MIDVLAVDWIYLHCPSSLTGEASAGPGLGVHAVCFPVDELRAPA